MRCKCSVALEAMGLPKCQLVPERIKRLIFTTSSEPRSAQNLGPLFDDPPWNTTAWPEMYKLVTPLFDVVSSERAEPVRETLGENEYFVRNSPRSITATVARKGAELGRLFDQLRCVQNLHVFLVDAEGIVWGRRIANNPFAVAPIPVAAPTLFSRMVFASNDAVQKWEFTLQLQSDFADYEFVPIWSGKDILLYTPPISVSGFGVRDPNSGDYAIAIFSEFAVSNFLDPAVNNTAIFHLGLTTLLQAVDAANNQIAGTFTANPSTKSYTFTPTSAPTAPFFVRINPASLVAAWAAAPGYDWASFRIGVTI